jgi:diguanylate cyclase (GGDEF)-like protein
MLTRCYNRGSTMAALERFLGASGSGPTGVIFIDLDLFKPVNDLLGHAAGDELLVSVAGRLGAAMRDDDIVGRIGGDEFLVVCPDIAAADDALVVARRIGESLTGEIALTAGVIDLRASIGVACSSPGMTADDLVARADNAMYQSKKGGVGVPVLYSSDTDAADTGTLPRRRVSRRAPGSPGGSRTQVPVLLGMAEIAACLGIAEHEARDLAGSDGSFPPPVGSVSSAPVWAEDDIVAFRTVAAR